MLEYKKCKNKPHTNFLLKIQTISGNFKEEEEDGEKENYDWGERDGGTFLFLAKEERWAIWFLQ